jgi:hypothetical protein
MHKAWYSSLSCIWAEHRIQLPEKISIATDYNKLKSFFVKVLDVAIPNLEMHILSLLRKAAENPDRLQIIQEMVNICAFNPTPEALEELSKCKCLPVKLSSDAIQWLDKFGEFAIVDHREYGDMFAVKVSFLDFSLEVHSLNPLLAGLELTTIYI